MRQRRHKQLLLFVLPILLIAMATGLSRVSAQAGAARVWAFETVLDGDDDRPLLWPVAVAVSPDDEVAVADSQGTPRVFFFTDSGVSWILTDVVELPAPAAGLAHDGSRWIVSLRGGLRLVALEGESHQQRALALPADAVPGALAPVPGGGVLVHDVRGNRVLRLSPQGSVSVKIALTETASAVAAAPGDAVLACLPVAGVVVRYDSGGRETARWAVPGVSPAAAWPVGLALDPGSSFTVSDRQGSRLVVMDTAGRTVGVGSRRGWLPGLLLRPGPLARLSDGRLAVVDEGNGRVQIFRRADSDGGS